MEFTEDSPMARFIKSFLERREAARTRRALTAAIDGASGPSLRDELILIAQRLDDH